MKPHRTDGVSLTFALIFFGLTGWWLIAQLLDLALPAVGWILAGGLILIGVFGLIGALRSGRSTPAPTEPTPAATAVDPVAGDDLYPDPVSGAPYEPVSGSPYRPVSGSPVPVTGPPADTGDAPAR